MAKKFSEALPDGLPLEAPTRGRSPATAPGAGRCRRKFLAYFPDGFADPKYLSWERGYKWIAHRKWQHLLNPERFRELLDRKAYAQIASLAVGIESPTHLLFSFEKMAIRDAVRSAAGSRAFALGLHDFLSGPEDDADTFDRWCRVVEALPRKQSRVFTWPVVTVFGFLARPDRHFFFKPRVTTTAAERYGIDLPYEARPSSNTYGPLLRFARRVRQDLKDLRPRDLIDIQSFLWVQGSDEYPELSSPRRGSPSRSGDSTRGPGRGTRSARRTGGRPSGRPG